MLRALSFPALALALAVAVRTGRPGVPARVHPEPAQTQSGCTATLPPGGDIGAAAAAIAGRSGATLCLGPDSYPSFLLGAAAAGVTVRGAGAENGGTVIEAGDRDGALVLEADGVTLTGLRVRGGRPAGVYVRGSRGVTVRDLRIDGAVLGLHVDGGATATLDGVTIAGSSDVGLLVRRAAAVTGSNVAVLDSAGTAIAAADGASALTLRGGEVGRAGGPGVFVGIPGCADLGAGTLAVPDCFLAAPERYVTGTVLTLDGVDLHDGPGTGVVLFPGTSGTLTGVTLRGWNLTGLFAWGATVTLRGATFDGNAEHAVEVRAYPSPFAGPPSRVDAAAVVEDSAVRGTRPLPDGTLGGGLLAQGARLDVRRTEVSANAAIGVSYVNGSTGEVVGSAIVGNGGIGLCLTAGAAVSVTETRIEGNGDDDPHACGG